MVGQREDDDQRLHDLEEFPEYRERIVERVTGAGPVQERKE